MISAVIPHTKPLPSNHSSSFTPNPLNSFPKTQKWNTTILRAPSGLNLRSQQHLRDSPCSRYGAVYPRLQRLVSEFQSLPEPMDRVKKLLDYAAILPRLGESTRSPESRVAGCAAQVWLEVEMDEFWMMKFGADSDSEITKGFFSSCLVYLLDGASPEEVLMVKAEDLADTNVGLPSRSRVNSWHNVLTNMQERTKSLMLKRSRINPPLDPLSSLV